MKSFKIFKASIKSISFCTEAGFSCTNDRHNLNGKNNVTFLKRFTDENTLPVLEAGRFLILKEEFLNKTLNIPKKFLKFFFMNFIARTQSYHVFTLKSIHYFFIVPVGAKILA